MKLFSKHAEDKIDDENSIHKLGISHCGWILASLSSDYTVKFYDIEYVIDDMVNNDEW